MSARTAQGGGNALPPWRRPARGHFPGVPSWGAPTAGRPAQEFPVERLPAITPEWAWGGSDGSGVRVCVLDSGVDTAHPWVGPVERSLEVVDDPGTGQAVVAECAPHDPAGHGTACAGIIRSVARGAALTSVRVLGNGRGGSAGHLLTGLRWAIAEGFDVVNVSVCTTRREVRDELHELADDAFFHRSVLVAAAHNMPVRSYPWTYASVVSVASHDEPDPLRYYYNPAPPVEFHARGVRVPVARPGGRTSLGTGNSFAAPHIAGLAARVLGKHPWLTPFQLKSVLLLSASNVHPGTGRGRAAAGDHTAGPRRPSAL